MEWLECQKLMNNPFRGNAATENGRKSEAVARLIYEEQTGQVILQCGLFVNVMAPWLGESPDGLIKGNGRPIALLEIKCPVEGQTEPAHQLLSNNAIPFLKFDGNNNAELKCCHSYYGQVQLGMAHLNLPYCNLLFFQHSIKVL